MSLPRHMRNAFHKLLMGVGDCPLPHLFGFSIIAAIGLLLASRVDKRIIVSRRLFAPRYVSSFF